MKFLICSPVSTSWHSEEDNFRAPPIDRSILPTAPRSAREPNIDMSRLPRNPPYTAFLGNLPYDITEDSIKDFFRGLAVGLAGSCTSAVTIPSCCNSTVSLLPVLFFYFGDVQISAVRLPREPSHPERLKGFGYAEFDDVESLLRALSLSEEVRGCPKNVYFLVFNSFTWSWTNVGTYKLTNCIHVAL